MTWSHALAPLRNRSFAWYFSSRLVSTLGTMMATVALAFAVLDITDSPTALGQVLAARTVPMVALVLYGGVIADRFPRTLVLQLSNLGSALSQGAVAVLVLTGQAEIWMLVVLGVVHGAVSGIGFPAMASVLPQLVPYAIAATRYGLPLAWKMAIIAEMLGLSNGVGYMLIYWFHVLNMVQVFAWMLLFTSVMLTVEYLVIKPLERASLRWTAEVSF